MMTKQLARRTFPLRAFELPATKEGWTVRTWWHESSRGFGNVGIPTRAPDQKLLGKPPTFSKPVNGVCPLVWEAAAMLLTMREGELCTTRACIVPSLSMPSWLQSFCIHWKCCLLWLTACCCLLLSIVLPQARVWNSCECHRRTVATLTTAPDT